MRYLAETYERKRTELRHWITILLVLFMSFGSKAQVSVEVDTTSIKIGEQITLHFTKVLDQRHLRVDDENPEIETAVDRAYWESRASQKTMQLCDRLLDIVNEQAGAQHQLAYLKRRIGLSDGARYIRFFPRKEHVRIVVRVPDAPAWKSRCEADELDTDVSRQGNLRFNVTPESLETHREILVEMIRSAVEEQEA